MSTYNITSFAQPRQRRVEASPALQDDLQADPAGIETVKLEIRKIFQLLVTPLKRNGLYGGVELRQDAQGNCDEKQLLDEDMDGT